MGFSSSPSRVQRRGVPAALDPAMIATLRQENSRDVRFVVLVLAAGLLAGLAALAHSLS